MRAVRGGGGVGGSTALERFRWLGHPAFLASVAVLAVNDHVLKARYPGWWTGKLSDVAGVAVVATVAAVLVRPGWGVVLAGVGFTALKVVPGVAEAAAPLLGGVTLRDASDLLALLVLIPTWLVLRSWERSAPGAVVEPHAPDRRERGLGTAHSQRGGSRARAVLATGLPLLGAVVATFTATATSCAPDPAVTKVVVVNGRFYAFVDDGYRGSTWASSDDGGRSWRRDAAPPGAADLARPDPYRDPGPLGPTQACTADETCWRLTGDTVERRRPGGPWHAEVDLSREDFGPTTTDCQGGTAGVLGSIAATDSAAGPQVVTSFGAGGVLARGVDGEWERRPVLGAAAAAPAPPRRASIVEQQVALAALTYVPAAMAMLVVLRRRRWPSWTDGLALLAIGWVVTVVAVGAAELQYGRGDPPLRAPLAVIGTTMIAAAAVLMARRPQCQPSPAPYWYPPPPPAPPSGPRPF